jgi:predicted DNA-binding transcriptional regulator AlpA
MAAGLEQLVGIQDVMAVCGVSRATVDRWVAAGHLRPVQLPVANGKQLGYLRGLRFRVADVEALTQGSTV